MSTRTMLLCLSLMFLVSIMAPAPSRSESAATPSRNASDLFEQIRDLELMQRNIETCYRFERIRSVTCPGGKEFGAWRNGAEDSFHASSGLAELDARLIRRVFTSLAGFPEYEKFIAAYRTLTQRPDFKRLHTGVLFSEYMRLLESARTRLVSQVNERQERLTTLVSGPARHAVSPSGWGGTPSGHAEGERARLVPAVDVHIQRFPDDGPPSAIRRPYISATTALPWSGDVLLIGPSTGESTTSN